MPVKEFPIKSFAQYFWQLPQALLFLAFRWLLKSKTLPPFRGIPVQGFRSPTISSFALGVAIFINSDSNDPLLLAHEYGHCRQSRLLGWAYLPVVGLPSLILNLLSRVSPQIRTDYYRLFPENWADRLGGVHR